MSSLEALAILPLLVVAFGAIAVLIALSVYRNQTISAILTVATLLGSLLVIPIAFRHAVIDIGELLRVDGFGLYCILLILVVSIPVTICAHSYLGKYRMERGEFYVLLLLSTLGALVLPIAKHWISFFLGLELLSVSLYVMIGYIFTKDRALEAALKYLFLAAATSAVLLFGMALVYAQVGTMEFGVIAECISASEALHPYVLAGIAMLLVGIGFKLSLVPFHQWAPDVFQGAPAPVTAFLATVSKAATLAVGIRFFETTGLMLQPGVITAVTLLAVASMTAGNLLALFQHNVKRILAYSSIAHFGYILVPLVANPDFGIEALLFYLTVYSLATVGAFAIIGYISATDREAYAIQDYKGLFWRRPFLGSALAVMLFSLIGLPLTGGFMGKLLIVSAGIAGEAWFLVLWLVLNSALGLFYYLRIVIAMYAPIDPVAANTDRGQHGRSVAITIGILIIAVVGIGIFPETVIGCIHQFLEAS